MKIKEFANRVGVSESAIRYYERIGVLHSIGRLKNGYREFDEDDVRWMEFVNRLRVTGMSMENIVEYARLREQGESSIADRLRILESHEAKIVHEMAENELHLQRLREKILHYKKS